MHARHFTGAITVAAAVAASVIQHLCNCTSLPLSFPLIMHYTVATFDLQQEHTSKLSKTFNMAPGEDQQSKKMV